jgi:RNA polymerase sigma-70 factor, ECF subfamily
MPNTKTNETKIDNQSDAQLVYLLREGEKKALAILYKRYAGLVYSVAYKILQDQQEAEDLTQDIFVTFWKKNSFDPNRGALSSFLGLLTRSRAIDKIRSGNTTENFLARWQKIFSEEASESFPLEQASLQERQEKLQQALDELPELQRLILEMNYFENLSQAKIAKTLNLPLGTVKSRSRQGILQLKKLLLERM